MRILFCAEAVTLAHVARPALLAKSLLVPTKASITTFNPEIHFASSKAYEFILRDTAFQSPRFYRHYVESQNPETFQSILDSGGILFDEKRLGHYVVEELKLIEQVKPDLIIGDLRPSLAVSAACARIPLWTITNGYWSPFVTQLPPPFPVFKKFRESGLPIPIRKLLLTTIGLIYPRLLPRILEQQGKGINTVRKQYGLAPFRSYLEGFTYGDRVLLADTPSLTPLEQQPSHYRFLGALSWSPSHSLPTWWDTLPLDRPTVYLSMGSSGPVDLVQACINAILKTDATVIVSTGGRSIPGVIASERIYLADFVPGELAARRADLVISNGGSPTSYQALREGVPVLGLATNMDQLLAMSRVAAAGAGIMLRTDLADEHSIVTSMQSILREHSKFAASAKEIQRELQAFDHTEIFPRLIEQLEFPTRQVVGY